MATLDLSKLTAQGLTIKLSDDVTIGPANKPASTKKSLFARKVEEWHGTPSVNTDGKTAMAWTDPREKCGSFTENDGSKRKTPCDKNIIITAIKRQFFQKDSGGYGGTLEYDDTQKRYYKSCPVHGPNPVYPTDENGRLKWE